MNATLRCIWHLHTTTDERLPNPSALDKVFDSEADTLYMYSGSGWLLIVGPSPTSWRSWN